MGFGGMGGAMAAKMGGAPKKKKPSFMGGMDDSVSGGDDGDQTVDSLGDSVANMDADVSGTPVNAKPEADAESLKDEDEGKELSSYGDVEGDAADEMASLAGVPEESRAAFAAALSDYVAACIRKQGA